VNESRTDRETAGKRREARLRSDAAKQRRAAMVRHIIAAKMDGSSEFEQFNPRRRSSPDVVHGWRLGSAPTADSLSKPSFWVLTADGLLRAANANGTLSQAGGRPDELDVSDRIRGAFAAWVDERLAELAHDGPGGAADSN
jgi:hypothetical protein